MNGSAQHLEPDRASDAEVLPSTIDDDPEVGVIENWHSHYGAGEQVARFESYSTRPDLLRRLFALEASSSAGAVFEPAWIEASKDRDLCVDQLDRRMFRAGRVIVGVDPARASGVRASWFVIVVVLYLPATRSEREQRIVLDLRRERGIGSVEAQAQLVTQAVQTWRAEVAAIEAVAGYGYLASYCDHSMRLPVRPIVTTKADADAIPTLAHEVARGHWHVPWGDARSHRIMGPLVAEMRDYPAGTTDCLMACSFTQRAYFATPAPISGEPNIRFLQV